MGKTELRIEIDAELLLNARQAGLDLTGLTEAAVREALRRTPPGRVQADERARQWTEENAEAIADYNRRIRERGVFSTGLRKW
jgi:antitoxin CcdA